MNSTTDTESGLSQPRVSVLILTKNEEKNIASCIRSCSWSDDIVVLDSCSEDSTREIAKRFSNVRVIVRPFDTEYLHRNFGLHEIDYRHPWVYICDADERLPVGLIDEMACRILDDDGVAAYQLRYKNMFMGRWLRHATSYPVWIMRLVRPRRVSYEERATNVHPVVDGKLGRLSEHFIHYSFNLGLRRWFEKHNFYSDAEAEELTRVRTTSFLAETRSMLRGELSRRRWMKNTSFRLPFRGRLRWLVDYLLRRGWSDGVAGYTYCRLICLYEDWIWLKAKQLSLPDPDGQPDPVAVVIARRIEAGFTAAADSGNVGKPRPSGFGYLARAILVPKWVLLRELIIQGRVFRGPRGVLEAYFLSGLTLIDAVADYERISDWSIDDGVPPGELLYKPPADTAD
ncbi:MAG: glycosyltransferase family 2 protein [Planctomycetota bacterium]